MIRRNLVANFVGRLWVALMSFAFVPVYIRFIGIEAYGLLGFLLSLQGLLALLDFGSYTINREFSDHAVRNKASLADTLRTFEIVYWIAAISMAFAFALAAPGLSGWVNFQALNAAYAKDAVLMFALAVGALWPSTLYGGALAGLERQVASNVVSALAATARGAGGALVVWQWSPTLEALLAWQALVNLMNTVALRLVLAKVVSTGRFRFEVLSRTARYSGGVTGILMVLTVLAQMDKLLLSRLLSLEAFGYYVLAWTLASVLSYFSTPVTTAIFPRLVRAYNAHQPQELARLYHLGCQLVGVLVVPVAAVLVCYAHPVLYAWTRNAVVADRAALLLQLLVSGSTINLLLAMSYSLQAAAGWNRLAFMVHAISIPLMAGLLVAGVLHGQAAGAAACWITLYTIHLIFAPYLMHLRILAGEYRAWFMGDVLLPVAAGIMAVAVVYMALPVPATTVGTVAAGMAAWIAGVAAQSVCSNRLRERLRAALASRP